MVTKMLIDRRAFLLGSASTIVPMIGRSSRLETLRDWFKADARTREAGVQDCLERIRVMDSSIHAWVQVLPQKAHDALPIYGIPFGAKDVLETRGLATEYGSPVYKGRVGTTDAAIVTHLRDRGAILLGKTHTAAFAYKDPPPTRNPRNSEHTPGGSSSGSAAAVAAEMVPFAIGTQTGGSVLRPASFCGVTGFKATYGLLPFDGVLKYAKSLDTLGFFTHTPDDMLLLWDAVGYPTGQEEEFALGVPDPLPDVDVPMAAAFRNTVSILRRNGVSCPAIDIASLLVKLTDAQNTVAAYEGARANQQRFEQYGDRLGQVAAMVRDGMKIPAAQYDEALRFIADSRSRFIEMYKRTPVMLVPAAVGPAPLGLSSTGDSRMNAPWTALGTPAISIPMPVGRSLPMGLQLTAAPGDDARILRTAARVHRILYRS